MFTFQIPCNIYFGENAINDLSFLIKKIAAKHVLFLYDMGIKKSGIADRVFDQIAKSKIKISCIDNITADPSESLVTEIANQYKDKEIDLLIAVGGGSVIDATKAINILLTNDNAIMDYEGIDQVSHAGLPFIAIPTTSGTASEVTSFTVITNKEQQRKMLLAGKNIQTSIALLDPTLTYGLPPLITAATGMDALTHAIEAYISPIASPISDLNAIKAIQLINQFLPVCYQNGGDTQARYNMMLGSLFAGFAFNSALLGITHSIAHVLGAKFHIPHGVANAIGLPFAMAFNFNAAEEKLHTVAKLFNLNSITPHSIYTYLQQMNQLLNIPAMQSYDVTPQDFTVIATEAVKEASLLTNPRDATADEIKIILSAMYYSDFNLMQSII